MAPASSVAWPRLSLSQAVEAAGGTRPHARLAWLCQAVGHLLCARGLAPGCHPLDGRVTVTSQERGTHNTGCWARATACPAGPGRSTGEGTACQRPAGTRSYPTSPLPQTPHPQSGMGRQTVTSQSSVTAPPAPPHPGLPVSPGCGPGHHEHRVVRRASPRLVRQGSGAFQTASPCVWRGWGVGVSCVR